MSQHDLEIANQTFPATRTDLNNALQALGSLQSGGTAPATTYANMLWYDTTNNILKLRNEDDDAWINVFEADQANDVIELLSKVKAPDGSASLPMFTFASDLDTGIYRKSSNVLAVTAGGNEALSISGTEVTVADSVKLIAKSMWPVGSIYINATDSTNPATLFGFGTWVAFGAGRVPVGYDGTDSLFDTAEETGGSKDAIVVSHTHTATSTVTDPGHTHDIDGGGSYDGSTPARLTQSPVAAPDGATLSATTGITVATSLTTEGSSGTNANLQPYITVYMWKRTA